MPVPAIPPGAPTLLNGQGPGSITYATGPVDVLEYGNSYTARNWGLGFANGTQQAISVGTYSTATGVGTVTPASTALFAIGNYIGLGQQNGQGSALTGTGAFAGLATGPVPLLTAGWLITNIAAGVITFQGPPGLGAATLTGGSAWPAFTQTTVNGLGPMLEAQSLGQFRLKNPATMADGYGGVTSAWLAQYLTTYVGTAAAAQPGAPLWFNALLMYGACVNDFGGTGTVGTWTYSQTGGTVGGVTGTLTLLFTGPNNVQPFGVGQLVTVSATVGTGSFAAMSGTWTVQATSGFSCTLAVTGGLTLTMANNPGNTAISAITAAQSLANLQAIYAQCKAWGKLLYLGSPYFPRSQGFAPSTAQGQIMAQTNNIVCSWARRQPGILFFDSWFDVADATSTTGKAAPNIEVDGIHLASFGTQLTVKRALNNLGAQTELGPLGQMPQLDIYDPTNNPGGNILSVLNGASTSSMFQGTGGTVGVNSSGQVPTGWLGGNNTGPAGTIVYAKVAATNGFGANGTDAVTVGTSGNTTLVQSTLQGNVNLSAGAQTALAGQQVEFLCLMTTPATVTGLGDANVGISPNFTGAFGPLWGPNIDTKTTAASAGTYTNSGGNNGQLAMTLASVTNIIVGGNVNVGAITGTGSFASLAGTWPVISVVGNVVTVQTTLLGATLTFTGASVTLQTQWLASTTYLIRTPPFVVPTGTTALQVIMGMNFLAGNTASITLSRPVLRIVQQ